MEKRAEHHSLMVKKWYKEGLRFQCTGCGKCCTGSPGYVWVTPEEVEDIATSLQIPLEECIRLYVRQVGERYSLRERPKNYDCVFLKDKKFCQVYDARPQQCRRFPWWEENLESPESWTEEKKRCEGIDHPDAPLIPLKVIEDALDN